MKALRIPLVALVINTIAFSCAARRVWNDTGVGTIVFEEAWTIPEITAGPVAPPVGQTSDDLTANLLDIHNQRLRRMDENGIDFMILSCASPCIQGMSDPVEAARMAVNVNNQLAAQISNNTLRFGGFAALSMHNATEAALELNRTVKELGFFGALVNDYQQSGPNNDTLIFFDQPEFDVFWQMVTDLDVPVYFHPRSNVPDIQNPLYSHAPWLLGPAQEFAVTLSTHILGLCTNGVFEIVLSPSLLLTHSFHPPPQPFSFAQNHRRPPWRTHSLRLCPDRRPPPASTSPRHAYAASHSLLLLLYQHSHHHFRQLRHFPPYCSITKL
ncbi:hypothetical protein K435DRAFT_192334 [Dendrothele bispora CBS 962.96]|uniref:Amidohydrolase-related domain-containing protein n=1 Tax=Dendrothele bispora (strain CBS 962.96) TaxID=1314807 RepID=A0A4S8LUU4_DENBC|nr:hypothetical protein K435DRAFT_192334 [Dendrothele bispora CBS 962.96]